MLTECQEQVLEKKSHTGDNQLGTCKRYTKCGMADMLNIDISHPKH